MYVPTQKKEKKRERERTENYETKNTCHYPKKKKVSRFLLGLPHTADLPGQTAFPVHPYQLNMLKCV